MHKFLIGLISACAIVGAVVFAFAYSAERFSDTEAGFEEGFVFDPLSEFGVPVALQEWRRPEGPLRVGLQVGHWKLGEVPEELKGLRRTSGAFGGGKREWEVNLAIARALAPLLEEKGIVVDILPATVPKDYSADAFISIHADGSPDPSISGYKAASPRRDMTGKSNELVSLLHQEYGKITGMRQDLNITRRMTGYYAFNWRRYEHSIHPMTVAVIMETGFLTSPADQRVLIHNPARSAQGMANAILKFFGIESV